MASQMIGKIKLTLCSEVNHWWHVTLHVTPTGLTTGLLHYHRFSFEIRMDLVDHLIVIKTSDGGRETIELKDSSVSDLYKKLFSSLSSLGIHIKIWGVPVETEDRVPFEKDKKVRSYNKETVENFVWILNDTERVLEEIRSKFLGKVSPIHFFWGSFDLSVMFFSGKKAPEHGPVPNVGRSVVLEAYSHEGCSMGFWPGMGYGEAAFFSYIYPEPANYKSYKIKPEQAKYSDQLMEFILPYSEVEQSGSDKMIHDFFSSSLQGAFELAGWDKSLLKNIRK